MGRDFNLPNIFKKVHPRNKTPYSALVVTGILIIFMALALPIEDVASAADIMFLLLFLQVNIAVMNIRKKWGDKLDYGYKMPFFPYVPIAGIISKMFLAIYMFNYSPIAWYATLIWIGLGIAVYFFYSIEKEEVEKAKVEREAAPEEYRAIAALANPEYVEPLMKIASGIAKIHKSELVALHVVEVPYQTFLHSGKQFIKDREPMLDAAVQFGENAGVSVRKKFAFPTQTIFISEQFSPTF